MGWDILNIEVGKIDNESGKVYITLKDHRILSDIVNDRQLSLADITNEKVPADKRKRPILFFLDDKLLTDTTNIRIPSKRLHRVVINEAKEMLYFKSTFPDVLILQLFTQPPKVMIR